MVTKCKVCNDPANSDAVQCLGTCKDWFHTRCANIPRTDFRKMCKEKKSNWYCNLCAPNNSEVNTPPDSIKIAVDAHPSIVDLVQSIIAQDESEALDINKSLTLAGEVGHALLIANNKLESDLNHYKQVNHNLESELINLRNQNEDFLILAKEEMVKLTSEKRDMENELTNKINYLNMKVELGLKLNDELLQQLDKENSLHTKELEKLNSVIQGHYGSTQSKSFSIGKPIESGNDEDIINANARALELEIELVTKNKIIKLLKDDLDKLSIKHQALIDKSEGLQLFINIELERMRNNNKHNQQINANVPVPSIMLVSSPGRNEGVTLNNLRDTDDGCNIDDEWTIITNCQNSQSTKKLGAIKSKPTSAVSLSVTNNMALHYPPINKNTVESGRQHKVLILADSHGRKLRDMLSNELRNSYEVISIFHPNATFGQVTADISALVRNFGKRDYVIVIGGSNDLGYNKVRDFDKCINHVADCTAHTNLIFTNIPHRHDLEIQDNLHWYLNSKFSQAQKWWRHVKLIDLTRLPRDNFTKHGLHLNYKGKLKLIKEITAMITSKQTIRRNAKENPPQKTENLSETSQNILTTSDKIEETSGNQSSTTKNSDPDPLDIETTPEETKKLQEAPTINPTIPEETEALPPNTSFTTNNSLLDIEIMPEDTHFLSKHQTKWKIT